jgi:hypothetical protein
MGASSFFAEVRAAAHEDPVRIVYRVHGSPGRLRYRLTWLRDSPAEAAQLAEVLSAVAGVVEARVRALTGSVLVLYDPDFVDEPEIVRALLDATGCDHVTELRHESPADLDQMLRDAEDRGSAVSRALVNTVEALHTDFLRFTRGRVSLASASALTMLAVGIGELASTKDIEMPKWHQLLWYAYQTFKDVQERYAAGHRVHVEST